jgi:hypothetical protein
MFKIKAILFLALLTFCLLGCSNALYFYETEKISLTLEARPDSSQPVQGSLGVKQRVVLVSPRTETTEGDALSAISSFNFKITPKPNTPFNPVLIQMAFITGDAASGLNVRQASLAGEAVALTPQLLNKQNDAVSEIGKLPNEELVQLFICNGRSEVSARKIVDGFQNLGVEEFRKKFKSLYRFQAERMLSKYKQCGEVSN